MFKFLKIPLAFLLTGICWALFSDPIISYLTKCFLPGYADVFRSINDLVFVFVIAVVLFFEIKKQQRIVTRSEEEYRQLFESNPNPMWIYHQQSLRFIKVNNAAVAKYQYSESEFLKMTIRDIRSADEQDKLQEFITNNGEQHAEGLRMAGIWKHTKKNGETFDVSITLHPVLFAGQNCRMVMITDMTSLLEKERQLQDSNKKIKTYNRALLQIAWSNSHELRKPICSMTGLINLLKNTPDEQERNECLNLLDTCLAELDTALLNNNNEVAKIEMGESVYMQ